MKISEIGAYRCAGSRFFYRAGGFFENLELKMYGVSQEQYMPERVRDEPRSGFDLKYRWGKGFHHVPCSG